MDLCSMSKKFEIAHKILAKYCTTEPPESQHYALIYSFACLTRECISGVTNGWIYYYDGMKIILCLQKAHLSLSQIALVKYILKL